MEPCTNHDWTKWKDVYTPNVIFELLQTITKPITITCLETRTCKKCKHTETQPITEE